jgi:chromatin segregation and condensation protein Rec8/ScpA/Scc1 (kleisin family)
MTEWGGREYKDYEELGRRLGALDEALTAFQQQVVRMWNLGSGETEQTRHLAPDAQVLEMVLTLQNLHRQLALECAAELGEADVPEGRPRIPPPFDRRALYSG